MDNVYNCSVCSTDFDEYSEGGTVGNFGMLPVALCPTCLSCMCDMADQMREEDDMEVAQAVEQMYSIARAVEKTGDGYLAGDIKEVADRLNKKTGPILTDDDMETIKRAT